MRIILCFVLLITFSWSYSANTRDSLNEIINNAPSEKEKFKLLIDIGDDQIYVDKEFAKTLLVKATTLAESSKDPHQLAQVYLLKGKIFEAESSYKQALEALIQANKYFEEVKDQKGIGQSLNSIGIIHWYIGNNDKAISYFEEGYRINKAIGEKPGMSTSLGNMAIIYDEQKKYDKALKNYKEVLAIFLELNNEWAVSTCYNNMGISYTALKNYPLAEEMHLKSLAIRKKLNDQPGIATSLVNIGYNKVEQGKYNEAIPYLKESLALTEKNELIYDKKIALFNLSKAYAATGSYKEAYRYHSEYSAIKDSILDSESKKSMQELETKYSTEKKSLEIQNLKEQQELTRLNQKEKNAKEAAQQKTKNTILFSIIGVILITTILFFLRYRQKKKDNLILQSKNEEISNQKNIIEEKNKDITDSIQYAKTIQDSVLPDVSLLEKHFSDSFVLFLPRDIVSGDFYWFTEIENKIIFTVGDCTGHGVPGSLMSMMGINILHQIVREEKITDPAKILHRLDENIKKQFSKENKELQSNDGMDIAIVLFDKNKNRIEYASAMRPLYFISDGELMELKNDIFPIGGNYDEKIFKTREVEIKKGDQLVLSTDGYADQFGGPKNKKFLTKKLKLLIQDSSQLPLAQQKEKLLTEFNVWKGTNEQVDDVCILGVKI